MLNDLCNMFYIFENDQFNVKRHKCRTFLQKPSYSHFGIDDHFRKFLYSSSKQLTFCKEALAMFYHSDIAPTFYSVVEIGQFLF